MSSSTTFRLRTRSLASAILPLVLLIGLFAGTPLFAAPLTREQALEAAYAWLSLSPTVMHEAHGHLAGTVTPVRDTLGETDAYAVDLAPRGYVIVAADDSVEPVIAFSTTDTFQAVPGDPLFDMLRTDVPARLTGPGRPTAPPRRNGSCSAPSQAPPRS